jgi:hypothetical protein
MGCNGRHFNAMNDSMTWLPAYFGKKTGFEFLVAVSRGDSLIRKQSIPPDMLVKDSIGGNHAPGIHRVHRLAAAHVNGDWMVRIIIVARFFVVVAVIVLRLPIKVFQPHGFGTLCCIRKRASVLPRKTCRLFASSRRQLVFNPVQQLDCPLRWNIIYGRYRLERDCRGLFLWPNHRFH